MFGYVNAFKPELKMKDFYKYKAYYCGLCRILKEKYGPLGQMTLTYDMTFLIVLLTSLYESQTIKGQHRCMVHPIKKHDQLTNEMTQYAADMNIVLTYHHFLDDWQDEKSVLGITGAYLLKRAYGKIYRQYKRQCEAIKKSLEQLHAYEIQSEREIDLVAGCFGELMAELFVFRQDQWEEPLRKMGFFLGKFIYIMDAMEDLEVDLKKNNYNPLRAMVTNDSYETDCQAMLTMMMAACTNEFEKLPCVLDIDILRNIVYVGVWTKFDALQNENNLKEGTKE